MHRSWGVSYPGVVRTDFDLDTRACPSGETLTHQRKARLADTAAIRRGLTTRVHRSAEDERVPGWSTTPYSRGLGRLAGQRRSNLRRIRR